MAIQADPPSTPPPPILPCDPAITDPPPPYPTTERRSRTSRGHRTRTRIQTSQTTSSGDPQHSDEARLSPYTDEDAPPTESSSLLTPNTRYSGPQTPGVHGRQRSHSFTSTLSAAPSLAHTVLSLLRGDEDDTYLREVRQGALPQTIPTVPAGVDNRMVVSPQRQGTGFFSRAAWKRYFRPLVVKSYYKSFFHLAVLNFPYGLAAWIYLFVFTLTGTILLVALPLGAVLCFLNLLGARTFSRGELALQTRFHAPLAHAPPYPPRPIFTRYREPTSTEIERGQVRLSRNGLVQEKSFYKNTYAMFTDPTSYQALFYFLIVKPAITMLISISIVAIGLPAFILILPAPAMLRAIRKVGIWQANIAVEGLYIAVH